MWKWIIGAWLFALFMHIMRNGITIPEQIGGSLFAWAVLGIGFYAIASLLRWILNKLSPS